MYVKLRIVTICMQILWTKMFFYLFINYSTQILLESSQAPKTSIHNLQNSERA